jgi:antitoxin VapB
MQMPICIKNSEVEKLARAVASETGETLTDAVRRSLEQRLDRVRGSRSAPDTFGAIMEISRRCSALPDLDERSAEEILGYDESGAPT